MHTFPKIETERLVLTQITSQDIPRIVELASNPKVAETTLNIPYPYTEKEAIFWINSANQGFEEKIQFTFAIRLKPELKFIGGIGLKINKKFERGVLGYWIGEPYWNKGYATEATKAILHFGFREINLHKIYATHLTENPASGKVMMKAGMIKEGEHKDHTKKGDSFRSEVQYRLTKDEYAFIY